MTQITVSESMAEQLSQSQGLVELVAPNGRVLGQFSLKPGRPPQWDTNPYWPWTKEEWDKASQEPPTGRSLPEIWRDLEGK